MVLVFGEMMRRRLVEQAEQARPEECCGVLLGREVAGQRVVETVVPARNVAGGDRCRRYAIDPAVLLAVHRRARETARLVLGYYHSHPADRAVPSAEDARFAWPDASYAIIGMTASGVEVRSWRLPARRAIAEGIAGDVVGDVVSGEVVPGDGNGLVEEPVRVVTRQAASCKNPES